MRKYTTICLLVILCLYLRSNASDGVGYHSAAFLGIRAHARQVAMGGTGTALADDINLIHYNVGGLGHLRHIMLAANFHNWIDDTRQGAVGLALPTYIGVIGVDVTYFNEGEIVEVDEFFRKTGGIASSNDIMACFGYGHSIRLLNKNLGFGAGIKLIQQNLVGQQMTTAALDLGAQWQLDHFSFGATVQNIGISKVKFDVLESPLPLTFRFGGASRLPVGTDVALNVAADVAWTQKQAMRYYLGGELVLHELLILRSGLVLHDADASPWAAGFGLHIPMEWLAGSRTRLDYAYAPLETFETAAHRFSLLFTFGVSQPDKSINNEMHDRLRRELEAAEQARRAAEAAELRARESEEEIARRLERIKNIAEASEGKIEVAPQDSNRILVSMRINFDFDKAEIRSEEEETLRRVGEILNTYPKARVHVAGHTDSIGTEIYNIHLSKRRVDSVMVHLSKKEKVKRERFYMPIGYGESRPVADNGTEEGRFRNRRVEFLLFTFDAVPAMPEGSAVLDIQAVSDSQIKIVCNGSVQFKTLALADPSRLVVDLPGIFILTDSKIFEINRGPFIRARVGYHDVEKFTRVVFDLKREITADVKAIDNFVVVKVVK
ncbi:PorV/PorQ family protein [candidate division KSB1 bacterium]|nr:PorV/PorQ family protein [candidate division KSB1 bacterium]